MPKRTKQTNQPERERSPFPFSMPRSGRVVINARCQCGAMQTKHGPGYGETFGHGACPRTGCEKFRWVKWVYEKAPKPEADYLEPHEVKPIPDPLGHCCYCGATEGLHVYLNATDPDSPKELTVSKPVYACNVCDPIKEQGS